MNPWRPDFVRRLAVLGAMMVVAGCVSVTDPPQTPESPIGLGLGVPRSFLDGGLGVRFLFSAQDPRGGWETFHVSPIFTKKDVAEAFDSVSAPRALRAAAFGSYALDPLSVFGYALTVPDHLWFTGETGHFARLRVLLDLGSYGDTLPGGERVLSVCTQNHADGLRLRACEGRTICFRDQPATPCDDDAPLLVSSTPALVYVPSYDRTDTRRLADCGPGPCNSVWYRTDGASFVDVFDKDPDDVQWPIEEFAKSGAIRSRFVRLPSTYGRFRMVDDLHGAYESLTGGTAWEGAHWFRHYDVGACSLIVRWIDLVDAYQYEVVSRIVAFANAQLGTRFADAPMSVTSIREGRAVDRTRYAPVIAPSRPDGLRVRFRASIATGPRHSTADTVVSIAFTMAFPTTTDLVIDPGKRFALPVVTEVGSRVVGAPASDGANEVVQLAELVPRAFAGTLPWVIARVDGRFLQSGRSLPATEGITAVFEELGAQHLVPSDLADGPATKTDAEQLPITKTYLAAFRQVYRVQARPEGLELILADRRSDPEYAELADQHPALCERPQAVAAEPGAGFARSLAAYFGQATYLGDARLTGTEVGLP